MYNDVFLHQFVCKDCGLESKVKIAETLSEAREKSISAWNQRKPMERILERLEEYRDDFMNDIYKELQEDPDNLRANRIINRFDEAIEIVKEEGGFIE